MEAVSRGRRPDASPLAWGRPVLGLLPMIVENSQKAALLSRGMPVEDDVLSKLPTAVPVGCRIDPADRQRGLSRVDGRVVQSVADPCLRSVAVHEDARVSQRLPGGRQLGVRVFDGDLTQRAPLHPPRRARRTGCRRRSPCSRSPSDARFRRSPSTAVSSTASSRITRRSTSESRPRASSRATLPSRTTASTTAPNRVRTRRAKSTAARRWGDSRVPAMDANATESNIHPRSRDSGTGPVPGNLRSPRPRSCVAPRPRRRGPR